MGKYKILVVDDEESLCEILKFNLELEGYEVDVAYSAEQALAMHPERYSLLLLDVMMGEISGFKMARMLKSSPETAAVPIIFCTAKDTEDDTVAGLNLGADDYISKPFSMREVTARDGRLPAHRTVRCPPCGWVRLPEQALRLCRSCA